VCICCFAKNVKKYFANLKTSMKTISAFFHVMIAFFMSLGISLGQPTVTNGSFDGTDTGWNNCGLTGPEVTYTENSYGGSSSTNYVAEVDNGDAKGLCQDVSFSNTSSRTLYIDYCRRQDNFAPNSITLQVCIGTLCTTFTASQTSWGYATFAWTFTPPSSGSLELKITAYDPTQWVGGTRDNYGVVISNVGFSATTPITLTNFMAAKNGPDVDITWQTATEINNDYFIIEKSKNSIDFTAVGIVEGAGNSQNVLNYQTTDPSPYNGTSYYRLKQTDFDGTVSYSKTIAVNVPDENIRIHPNPGTGIFTVQGLGAGSEITVHNTLGETILIKRTFSDSSEIDLSNQSSGIYYIKVNEGETSTGTKIILNR
jgi:hypothetical protein